MNSLPVFERVSGFPIDKLSYSALVAFSSNPTIFRIKYLNRQRIDSTTSISAVIGKAVHLGIESYCDNTADGDRTERGLNAISYMLQEYPDGFIEFTTTVPNKAKAFEIATFAFNAYVKEQGGNLNKRKTIATEFEFDADSDILGGIRLRGFIDRLDEPKPGVIDATDYKVVSTFSDSEKIDGAKMLQAIHYFYGYLAHTGKQLHSMTFQEIKRTKNRDNSPQVREYKIVYSKSGLMFEFYHRYMLDFIDAMNGKMVYVPNVFSMFDNEVAMVSYIHRLDTADGVENGDFNEIFAEKLQKSASLGKYLTELSKKFINHEGINYDDMEIEKRIQVRLLEHGIPLEFKKKANGLSVDLYMFSPAVGVKMSKIMQYSADIEQVVGKSGIRILAPIPNTTFIGFEVPAAERKFVDVPQERLEGTNIYIGADVFGNNVTFDLAKAPHMLVAGASGSGKSVFLNSVISQLIKNDDCTLTLVDPKMVELIAFSKAKNVRSYLTDGIETLRMLFGMVDTMNLRYEQMAKEGKRSYEGKKHVIVIDEFGDLVLSNTSRGRLKDGEINVSAEIMDRILILAQKGRAAGIHLVIATQRPSTDIITGTVKANFPTKVAFRMAKEVDSRVLLDQSGAEKLLGMGDMIFASDLGTLRLQSFNA